MLVAYIGDSVILNMPNWKWARCLAKNNEKSIRMLMIFSVQTKKNTTKLRYGFKVSHNVKEYIKFHKNVNTLRNGKIGREVTYIKDFHMTKPLKRDYKAPDNHDFVLVHTSFDVKF